MAPEKTKTQTKKSFVKFKSKEKNRKKGLVCVKMSKSNSSEKPLTGLKWFKKLNNAEPDLKCDVVPEWLNNDVYKAKEQSDVSAANSSEYEEYQEVERKSSSSDASDECNCPDPKFSGNNHPRNLKKGSSSNSLVSKYIKLGMNQVASFIVESAIRFGEEHGVVVPDKNTPNLYEVTPPDGKLADKIRKIRFKSSEKLATIGGKLPPMWKSDGSPGVDKQKLAQALDWRNKQQSTSWGSSIDSLDDILPILEKLKQGGEIIDSDLDLDKLGEYNTDESNMEWEQPSEMDRERERERNRYKNSELRKKRRRAFKKRFKSLDSESAEQRNLEEDYNPEDKTLWRKFRRDSLELGRRRLKAKNCSKKVED